MMANAMPLSIFMYSITNMVFYYNVKNDWSAMMITAVCITGVFIFIPLRKFLSKIFVKDVDR
jgi:hypothetical protein